MTEFTVSGWVHDKDFMEKEQMNLAGTADVAISYQLELSDGTVLGSAPLEIRDYINIHGHKDWALLWQFIDIKSWNFQIDNGAYSFKSNGDSNCRFAGESDDLSLPFAYNQGGFYGAQGNWVEWNGANSKIVLFDATGAIKSSEQCLITAPDTFTIQLFDLHDDALESHHLSFKLCR